MRGRPFEVTWCEGDVAEALKAAYQGERDIELRPRLHGLWLLRSGWRLASVAAAVGVHYRTVQRWVGWYREGGLPKVLSHKMGGKGQEPFLTDEAQEQVAEEVATGRFRTATEISEWIAEQYGVTYKTSSIYSLMSRLNCAPKVPRPIHTKADQKQQASWKGGGGLQQALAQAGVTPQTPLGFADEMRVGLRGMVRRVWGLRGVKVRQRLQLVYKWRYLFLVVDVRTGELHWSWIDSMKAEMVGAAVNGLKQQTEVAAVVWDGAPSHRDQRVHGLGLPLIGLPPYSPELNPAERVFEEVRRRIEGKVYPSIEDKVAAVEAFLTELESTSDRVRTLTGWDWIEEAIQGCPARIAA